MSEGDNVGKSGAEWGNEVEAIGNYLGCNVPELKSEMLPLLEKAYKQGASDFFYEVEHAMNANEPKPGWWSRVKVVLRVKYDL